MNNNYYGVTQLSHGHEYRWIFRGKVLVEALGLNSEEEIIDCSGKDLLFPMGGSNASCMWIEKLESDEAAVKYLLAEGDGPDSDDPSLVDIAEYRVTVSNDSNSCTQEIIEKFALDEKDLSQMDDIYHHYAETEKMIKDLKLSGYKDFDYDNPYYGKNRDMKYSELFNLWMSNEGI